MIERKSCRGCIYHKQLSNEGIRYCDYLCMTGTPRGCPAAKCLRKEKKTRYQNQKKGSAK